MFYTILVQCFDLRHARYSSYRGMCLVTAGW